MPRAKKEPVNVSGVDLSGLAAPDTYTDESEPVDSQIIDWVENSYQFWLKNQDKWRTVVLATEKDRIAVVEEARRYCNKVRDEPLTFQIKGKGTSGGTLVYRVRESLRRS